MAVDWGAVGSIGSSAVGSIGDFLTGGYFSRKAWARQKEAMQNAHQWEVADLRAAGLNPILSATGGSGASTGGLTGSMVGDTSVVSRGVSSAYQGLLAKAQLENLEAQNENLKQDNLVKKSQELANYDLASMYRTQALTNTQNAYQLWRDNNWYDNNKAMYNIRMGYQSNPGVPYGLSGLLGALSGSAKSYGNAFDRKFEKDALNMFGQNYGGD